MADSFKYGALNPPMGLCTIPARTPGPLGMNDQADPRFTSLLGDTPGTLGINDYADPSITNLSCSLNHSHVPSVLNCSIDGVAYARSTSQDQPLNSNVLIYQGTKFHYQATSFYLSDCLNTLPTDLRVDFKKEIETIITKMHELGFAVGIKNEHKAGYRTFQDQYDIPSGSTRAGPGESLHNYLSAVDLGFLDWVDENGRSYSDYWLSKMDNNSKYRGFSSILWKKRNSFSANVYPLSFEIIHLQSVPQNTSGRGLLVKCLNLAAAQANDTEWKYRLQGNNYQSNLGGTAVNAWKTIGSAKQMWDSSVTNCTDSAKKIIRKHMELAETIAKTVDLG